MRHRHVLWFGLVVVVLTALTFAYTAFWAAAQGPAHIEYGDIVEGTIAAAGVADHWEFVGTQGDVISLRINRTAGNLTPTIALTDPTGVLVTSLDWPSEGPSELVLTATLHASGTHILTISSMTTVGSYALGLQTTGTQDESLVLAYGRAVSSAIDDATFRQFWTFRGAQGDIIDVTMDATAGDLDTYLSLVSPQGDVLVTADAGGMGTNAALYAVVLPVTGNYSLIARRAGDNFGESGLTQGSYTLMLTLRRAGAENQEPTPISLTPGTNMRSRLNADTPTALFSVNASGVLAIALDMAHPAQIGTLSVMTTGKALLSTVSGITPVRTSVTLPGPGTYWIEVSADNLRNATPLDFSITVEQLAVAQRAARPLLYDRSQQISASSPQPGTWYFHGQAGDLVDVTVTLFNPETDPTTLQITGPDGTLLAVRPVRASLTQSLLLTDSGAYEIAFGARVLTAGYQIAVHRRGMSGFDFRQHAEPEIRGMLPVAGAIEGTLPAGGADSWTIDIQEAQTWEFRLNQTGSDVPAALVVKAPDGTWLGATTTDRLSNSAALRIDLPHGGRYHILVVDPTLVTTHTYTLRGGPSEGGELALGTRVKGELNAASPADRWTVRIPPEILLNLNLTQLRGTNTPGVHIIGPDGLLVASNMSGEWRDSQVMLGIPVTYGGQYEIVVAQAPDSAAVVYQMETHIATPFGVDGTITPAVDRLMEELFVADSGPAVSSARVQLADYITPRIRPDAEFLAAAVPLDFATLERGEIKTDQPYQAWRFSANAGQMIAFSVVALEENSSPDMLLLAADGVVLTESFQAAASANYIMHRFAASGTYTLVVSLEHRGRYTLFAEVLARIDETVPRVVPGYTMAYGDTVYGEIIRAGDTQQYVFWGKAGDTINARILRTAGNTRLTLSLADAGGTLLRQAAMTDSPLMAGVVEFSLPVDALYWLTVAQEGDDAGLAGRFALNLTVTRTSALKRDGGVLRDHQPRIASLETNDPAHHWLLAGQAGERITIRLEPLTDGAPTPLILQVADSGGHVFLQKEASIGQSALVFDHILLPRTGVYQAIVSGGRTPGIYRISLARDARSTQDDERAIRYGETMGKVLTPENFLDVWTFAGTKGDVISAAARAVRGDRPALSLQLRTQSGVVLDTALDEGAGSRLDQIVLPLDGHYSLIVGNLDGAFAGEAAYDITLLLEDSAARSMGSIITYGQTVEGYFFLDDATDTWLIEGQQGDVIRATVRSVSPDLYPVMELVSTDWRAASASGQAEQLISTQGADGSPGVFQIRLPTTGVYALVVRDQALVGGPYTIRLDTVLASAAMPVSLGHGQSQIGQIGDIHVADIWQFEGAAGERITITVEPEIRSLLAPSITLISADGTVLAASGAPSGSDAHIEAYPLPQNGIYEIVVSRYLGTVGHTEGRYTISLQGSAADARSYPAITYDQVQRGALGMNNVRDTWTLNGAAVGDLVRIYAEATSGDLDPMLRIVDARGNIVAHLDDQLGLNPELYWLVPAGGPFTIEVARYGAEWGITEGNYALVVDSISQNESRTAGHDASLAYGDRVAGSVDSRTRSAVWGFTGEQGDMLYAKLQFPRDDSPLTLYLRDAAGAILATGERDRGDSIIASFTLAYGGAYTLEVRRPGDARAIHSPYTLELALLAVTQSEIAELGNVLAPGQSITARFDAAPALHTWLFVGSAQTAITVTAHRLDGMLPQQMNMYGPDGSLVFAVHAPSGTANRLTTGTVQLPYDGLYVLVITGDEIVIGSHYRLTLREIVDEPLSRSISLLEDGYGAITAVNTSEQWLFEAEAGDRLTLQVSTLVGDLVPTLIVWGPDRRPLAEGARAITTDQVVINALIAPESGVYVATVGRAGATTGEYRIMLRHGAVSTQAGSAQDVTLNTQVAGYTTGKSTAYYAFRGAQDDVIGISVRLTESGTLPDLALETEGGAAVRLPVVTTERETYIPAFGLPEDGRYVIRLDSHTTVGYALTVVRRQAMLPDNAIVRNLGRDRMVADGVLDPARPIYWQFSGESGDVLTFTIDTSGGGLRADVTLFGPDGYIANGVEYPGPDVTLGPVRLPVTGIYWLVVGPWLGTLGGSTGQYTVRSVLAGENISGSDGGPIPVLNQRVTGGLIPEDIEDEWTFEGSAGDLITILAEQIAGEGFLNLKLTGPEGEALLTSQPAAAYLGAEMAGFTLPADGQYTVTVSGGLMAGRSLEYQLVVLLESPISQGSVMNLAPVRTLFTPIAEALMGRLTAAQPVQSWVLHPLHTGAYLIEVEALVVDAAFDVFVLEAENVQVFRAGRYARVAADLSAGRDYPILVSGGPALVQGQYALRIRPAIALTQSAQLTLGQSNVGQITNRELHNEWRVQGQSNTAWDIEIVPSSGDLIPVVTLVAPTGAVLQQVAGSAHELLAVTFQIPADGVYGIEISRVGQTTGDYAITLKN